jgi:hypothetical protein
MRCHVCESCSLRSYCSERIYPRFINILELAGIYRGVRIAATEKQRAFDLFHAVSTKESGDPFGPPLAIPDDLTA